MMFGYFVLCNLVVKLLNIVKKKIQNIPEYDVPGLLSLLYCELKQLYITKIALCMDLVLLLVTLSR